MTAHFRRLAHTHAMRWHVAHGTVGRGPLYQGHFKRFPLEGMGRPDFIWQKPSTDAIKMWRGRIPASTSSEPEDFLNFCP